MANLTTNLETLKNGKQKVINSVTAKLKKDPQLTIDCTWDDISDAIDDIEVVPDPVIDPDTNVDLTKLCSRTINESIKVESPTIPDYVFQYQASLPLFKAPNATSVGSYALRSCTSLTKVELPEVTTINTYAFSDDTNLVEVDAPKVTTINSRAFYNCAKLDTFDFSNVKTVQENSFYNNNFNEIILPELINMSYSAFSNSKKATYFSAPKLTSTSAYNFTYNSPLLEEINLPKLEYYATSDYFINTCAKLTTVNLPELNQLHGPLITGCAALQIFSLPNLEETYKQNFSGYDYAKIIHNCANLTTVNLPKLKQFSNYNGNYMIETCYKLKTINMPNLEYCYDSPTSSSSGSYNNLNYFNLINKCGIESIALNKLKYANPSAYVTLIYNCKELQSVSLNSLEVVHSYITNGNVYSAVIIGGCPKLKSITLPSLVRLDGSNNFKPSNNNSSWYYYDSGRVDGYLESIKKWWRTNYPSRPDDYWTYSEYQNYYIYKNGSVPTWDGPSPATNPWGSSQDNYNTYCGLQSIYLPKLSKFSTQASDYKYMCYRTEELEVLSLGDGTFVPETTYLPRRLVYQADKLTTVILNYPIVMTAPYAITEIFGECPHLTGTIRTTYFQYAQYEVAYANEEGLKDLYFYVPDDLVEDYKAATNWSVYADQIKPISELADLILEPGKTIINEAEFKDNQNLTTVSGTDIVEVRASGFENTSATSISLPKAVAVRDYAFKDSNQLSSLTLKRDSVTSVGEGAFMNTALASFELNAATTLSKYLFKNTSTLVTISVNNAKYVGEEAFVGTSLGNFNGPDVVRINANAFKNVATLSTITLPEIKIVDDGAFDGASLTSISLPKVSYIGDYAFANNDLASISIPLISTIKEGAFANNTNLESVNLYEVLTVEDDAFDGCTSLTDVTITGYTVPELNNLSTDITLHVRAELLVEYQAKYPNHTIIGDVQ